MNSTRTYMIRHGLRVEGEQINKNGGVIEVTMVTMGEETLR